MRKLLYQVFNLGLDKQPENITERSNKLANQINVVIFLIMLALLIFLRIMAWIEHSNLSFGSLRALLIFLLSIICLVLAYYKHHFISKLLIVFLPSVIFLILPSLVGFVEEESFTYYPFLVVTFSILPQLLLHPEREKLFYNLAMIYFIVLLLFIDKLLVLCSSEDYIIYDRIKTFYVYYKVSHIIVFVFVYWAFYYLRRVNTGYENTLHEANLFLKKQSKILKEKNNELESSWQELELKNISLEELRNSLEDQNIELQKALKELKETQAKLIRTEKLASLGVLIAGVAHEVNNPLNYISGGVMILESEIEDIKEVLNRHKVTEVDFANNKQLENALTMIKEGVLRLQSITSSLHSYSSNTATVKKQDNVSSIIDSAISFLSDKINISNIKVERNFSHVDPIPVYADKLHQVFINIVDNAVFALNSININSKKIRISVFKKNNRVTITIVNNGPKFLDEAIPKIFDPFFTTKDTNEGTGLGMAISFNIIKDHGGDIDVINEEGSVGFEISLPA
ncbi:MAG: GHKL domain-containing protein [Bacteroidales bacterium]|nr:GHKL domain-containing protein [Bacteroidales bacterium]MBN2820502.1 GHKL domain-containing protein [Bacteroidales bacterium]